MFVNAGDRAGRGFKLFKLQYWAESSIFGTVPTTGFGIAFNSIWSPIGTGNTINIVLQPKGLDAGILVAPPDGSTTNGAARGLNVLDFQLSFGRNASTQICAADGTAMFNTYRCSTVDSTNNRIQNRCGGIYSSQTSIIQGSNWNGPGAIIGASGATLDHPQNSVIVGGSSHSIFCQGSGGNAVIGGTLCTLDAATGGTVGSIVLGGRQNAAGLGNFTLSHGYQSKQRGCDNAYAHGTNSGGVGGVQWCRYLGWAFIAGGGLTTTLTTDGGAVGTNNVPGPFPSSSWVTVKGVIEGHGSAFADAFMATYGPFLAINNAGTISFLPAGPAATVIVATGAMAAMTSVNVLFGVSGTRITISIAPPATGNNRFSYVMETLEQTI